MQESIPISFPEAVSNPPGHAESIPAESGPVDGKPETPLHHADTRLEQSQGKLEAEEDPRLEAHQGDESKRPPV